jgi:hypothetical protein
LSESATVKNPPNAEGVDALTELTLMDSGLERLREHTQHSISGPVVLFSFGFNRRMPDSEVKNPIRFTRRPFFRK